jgi:hypothetical protein
VAAPDAWRAFKGWSPHITWVSIGYCCLQCSHAAHRQHFQRTNLGRRHCNSPLVVPRTAPAIPHAYRLRPARRASSGPPSLRARSARRQPKCASRRAFAGSACTAVRRPSRIPYTCQLPSPRNLCRLMDERLRQTVRERADHRWEYCCLLQNAEPLT